MSAQRPAESPPLRHESATDPQVTLEKEAPENGASPQALPEGTYSRPLENRASAGVPLSEKFANLQPWQCRKELLRRKIPVRGAGMPAPGVATPLRLRGPVGPVRFVTPNAKSKHGILDCRLALLIDEIAPHLAALSVEQVHVGNFYRPKSRLPSGNGRSQHAHGLAMDIFRFVLTDGTKLDIEPDFQGVLGKPVCGPGAAFSEKTREAVLLRNIVCELGRLGAFNYFLTPNYDVPHRNHLHADIKRGTRDHVVR